MTRYSQVPELQLCSGSNLDIGMDIGMMIRSGQLYHASLWSGFHKYDGYSYQRCLVGPKYTGGSRNRCMVLDAFDLSSNTFDTNSSRSSTRVVPTRILQIRIRINKHTQTLYNI